MQAMASVETRQSEIFNRDGSAKSIFDCRQALGGKQSHERVGLLRILGGRLHFDCSFESAGTQSFPNQLFPHPRCDI